MTPTLLRDSIPSLATDNWKKALQVAESIDNPWFRCLALAAVALFIPDKKLQRSVLEHALASGNKCSDPNRIVTVSAWPIKELYSLGFENEGEQGVERVLWLISAEPSPVRRADALHIVLKAILISPRPTFWRVYDPFFTACTTPLKSGKKNSKGESLLVGWAGLLSKLDNSRSTALLAAIKSPIHKANAEANILQMTNKSVEEVINWLRL
jgi:hypothetical protein